MPVLVVEVDVLADLAASYQFAHWKVVDVAPVPVPVDLSRQTDVDGVISPTFHAVVKDCCFLADDEPITLKPRILDELIRLISHMEERELPPDGCLLKATADT